MDILTFALERLHQVQELATNNAFFLPILIICLLTILRVFKVGSKLNLPPSPSKLPIIGNLHQLGALPHLSLTALSKKYGPVMLLHYGQVPTLLVSSFKMARELINNHDIVISNRPKTHFGDIICYGYNDIVFSPYGETWRHAKKICTVEMLSMKRVESFQFIREAEAVIMMEKLRRFKYGSVNLSKMLMVATNNIVSRSVFGRQVAEEDDGDKFGQAMRKMSVIAASFNFNERFPRLKFLDYVTGYVQSLKNCVKELDIVFDQIIKERKAAMRKDELNDNRKNFVDILLQIQEDGIIGVEFSNENLKGIILNMFFGGTETTASTIEWMMAELIRNPNIMKKVQTEVRSVVGNKAVINMEDIKRMGYLKCVLKETLRFHPNAPLLIPRQSSKSFKLGGFDIPSNTIISVNIWAIHMDPNLWDMPTEFMPERFENNKVDFKGQDYQFLTFGFGRRICPGIAFGTASIEHLAANLLYWFDWKLPGDQALEELDMSETYGQTVTKKVPLHLVPIPRSFPFV